MLTLDKPILGAALIACFLSGAAWLGNRSALQDVRASLAPYLVSKDVTAEFAGIRTTAEDSERGASLGAPKLKELRENLETKVNALTSPQRQLLAQEVERASWALEVRNLTLETNDVSASGLLARRVVAGRLKAEVPTNAPAHLIRRVEDEQAKMAEQAMSVITEALAEEGKRLQADQPRRIEDGLDSLDEAQMLLGGWSDDPKFSEMRKQVDRFGRLRELGDSLRSWSKRHDEEMKIQKLSERLELIGVLGQEFDELRDQSRGLALEGVSALKGHLEQTSKALIAEQAAISGEIRRAYQSWALSQIALFGEASAGGKMNVESVTKYLLPIDESFLERPVAQLYQETFQGAWDALKAKRVEIAKASAIAVKRKPEDIIATGGAQ